MKLFFLPHRFSFAALLLSFLMQMQNGFELAP